MEGSKKTILEEGELWKFLLYVGLIFNRSAQNTFKKREFGKNGVDEKWRVVISFKEIILLFSLVSTQNQINGNGLYLFDNAGENN